MTKEGFLCGASFGKPFHFLINCAPVKIKGGMDSAVMEAPLCLEGCQGQVVYSSSASHRMEILRSLCILCILCTAPALPPSISRRSSLPTHCNTSLPYWLPSVRCRCAASRLTLGHGSLVTRPNTLPKVYSPKCTPLCLCLKDDSVYYNSYLSCFCHHDTPLR